MIFFFFFNSVTQKASTHCKCCKLLTLHEYQVNGVLENLVLNVTQSSLYLKRGLKSCEILNINKTTKQLQYADKINGTLSPE